MVAEFAEFRDTVDRFHAAAVNNPSDSAGCLQQSHRTIPIFTG